MNGLPIQGVGGVVAEVSAANELYVSNPNGVPTTNLYGEPFEVGNNGRVRVSPENHLLNDTFSGSALNTNLWAPSTTTMTQAVSNGILNMNSGGSSAANAYSIVNSIIQPSFWCDYSSYVHFRFQATYQTHSVIEFGWGSVATNAAPTDGIFFRISGAGIMSVVMSYGGSETTMASSGPIDVTKCYEVQMEILNDAIKWYVADANNNTFFTDGGSGTAANPLHIPATQMKPVLVGTTQQMPVFARVYNDATGGAAPVLKIGHANYILRDVTRLKDWRETLASQGRGSYQGPAASSLTQTANHANSVSPSSATLSNTAPGYTTLGGRWQFAAPAGAATDFVLFAFQIPTGFQLIIEGISISAVNTGAAAATTATILDWSIAVDSSAASLATTESPPASWAPRRLTLGMQSFVVGAAIGAMGNDLVRLFPTPIVCNSGRFIQVIVQVPVGTATASQVIRGDVMINGYFE